MFSISRISFLLFHFIVAIRNCQFWLNNEIWFHFQQKEAITIQLQYRICCILWIELWSFLVLKSSFWWKKTKKLVKCHFIQISNSAWWQAPVATLSNNSFWHLFIQTVILCYQRITGLGIPMKVNGCVWKGSRSVRASCRNSKHRRREIAV